MYRVGPMKKNEGKGEKDDALRSFGRSGNERQLAMAMNVSANSSLHRSKVLG